MVNIPQNNSSELEAKQKAKHQEMPSSNHNNLNYIHLAKYLKLERESV